MFASRRCLVSMFAFVVAGTIASSSSAATEMESGPGATCGPQWSAVKTPAPVGDELTDVVAISATDAWAVGASGRVTSQGLTEHWNGLAWSAVPFQHVGKDTAFYGVSATSSTDVWAVGYFIVRAKSKPLVEHWDGSTWSALMTPELPDPGWFYGVVAISSNDVWGVGLQTVGSEVQPLIEHWDGASWSIVSSPSLPSGGILYHA